MPSPLTDLVGVDGQAGHGVDDDGAGAGRRVDQVAAVALPERVQHRGLVQVPQLRQLLALVKLRRVRLQKGHTGVRAGVTRGRCQSRVAADVWVDQVRRGSFPRMSLVIVTKGRG